MQRLWRTLHAIASSPWVALCVGLVMFGVGVLEFVEFALGSGGDAAGVPGASAIVLLGGIGVLLAVEDVTQGLTTATASGMLHGARSGGGRASWLGRLTSSHPFRLVTAAALVAAGVAEGIGGVVEAEEALGRSQVWHLALVLVGAMGLLRGLAALLASLQRLEDGDGHRGGWRGRVLEVLERPRIEGVLAASVFAFCALEVGLELRAGQLSLSPHHALLLHATRTLLVALPDLFEAIEMADESHELALAGPARVEASAAGPDESGSPPEVG